MLKQVNGRAEPVEDGICIALNAVWTGPRTGCEPIAVGQLECSGIKTSDLNQVILLLGLGVADKADKEGTGGHRTYGVAWPCPVNFTGP